MQLKTAKSSCLNPAIKCPSFNSDWVILHLEKNKGKYQSHNKVYTITYTYIIMHQLLKWLY